MPPEEFLTTEEVAALVRASTRTLEDWRYRDAGGPPWVRVCGKVRYPRSAYDAWATQLTDAA